MFHYVYSLPAHENVAVLIDQIKNINRFNKHYTICIVLHLSKRFDISDSEWMEIAAQPNVIINPERLFTGLMNGSVFEAHLSNISLLYSRDIDFGHIIFLASNLMFVRPMWNLRSDFIESSRDVLLHKGWLQAWMAVRDKNINNYKIYGCQIEGLFISKPLLDKMFPYLKSISYKQNYIRKNIESRNAFFVKIIRYLRKKRFNYWVKTNYPLQPIRWFTFSHFSFARIAYATDEVYFATIANLFEDQFVFSGKELSFQDWGNSIIVTKSSVDWLRSDENKEFVCTKRVDRIYDDPIRVYIRELPDNLPE
jgi:hypothetical protein